LYSSSGSNTKSSTVSITPKVATLPNFYLAHSADKMADFLPSAKNANFYLAHSADKMADFLPSAKNAPSSSSTSSVTSSISTRVPRLPKLTAKRQPKIVQEAKPKMQQSQAPHQVETESLRESKILAMMPEYTWETMLYLKPKELGKVCSTSKFLRDLCLRNDNFWEQYTKIHSRDIVIGRNYEGEPVWLEENLIKTDPTLSWRELFTNVYKLAEIRDKYNRAGEGYSYDKSKLYDDYIVEVDAIGKKGMVDVLRPFFTYDWMVMATIYKTALRYNLVEIIDYMIQNRHNLRNQWDSLISNAQTESAAYLESQGIRFNRDSFAYAAGGGNLPLVKYLVETKGTKPSEIDLEWAVNNNHPKMIKYFWSLGMDKHIGANKVFESINNQRYGSDESIRNYEETLKMFMDNNIWGTNHPTIWWAIQNDRPDVLEYIYNETQMDRSHQSQYEAYKEAAQDKPLAKAWFDTKKPIFYFDSMSAGGMRELKRRYIRDRFEGPVEEAVAAMTEMGYSSMQALVALERILSNDDYPKDTDGLIREGLKTLEEIEAQSKKKWW
jgi:hypothetical protein